MCVENVVRVGGAGREKSARWVNILRDTVTDMSGSVEIDVCLV